MQQRYNCIKQDREQDASVFTTMNDGCHKRYVFGSFKIDPAIHLKCVLEWISTLDASNNQQNTIIKFGIGMDKSEYVSLNVYLFDSTSGDKNYGYHAVYRKNKQWDYSSVKNSFTSIYIQGFITWYKYKQWIVDRMMLI